MKVAHHGSADQDPALYALADAGGRAGDRRRRQRLRPSAGRDPRRCSTGSGRADRAHRRRGAVAVSADGDRAGGVARARRRASAPVGRLGPWLRARDAAPAAKARSAIPQLSWRVPAARADRARLRVPKRSAPSARSPASATICAPRTRASRSPTCAPTTTTPGTLLGVTSPSLFGEPRLVRVSGVEKCSDAFLAEAVSYLAFPQEGATVILRHTGATVRGKKLLDAIRAGEGGGVEIACPPIKRDSDRFDFAAGEFQAAKKRIAPVALRTLVSAFADDLTELGCRLPAADRRCAGRRHRAGRRALLRRPGRDVRLHRRRHGDRRPLRRGAHRAPPRARVGRRPGAARRRRRIEAAHDGARRGQPRVVARRWLRGSG